MFVPFSVNDFIDRAADVYGRRIGVVDEPDQPAAPLGGEGLTYAEVRDLAGRMAARLDDLGIAVGERVAMVSHNSARLLTAFWGVAGSGRVLVPVNFRLRPDEVRYIVEDSGARVLWVDPELDEALVDVRAEHRFVLGDDDSLFAAPGAVPRPWEPDENATATINYTSGTTARPKGVQLTHRNMWTDAVTFAMHTGLTDRDVYLHTLPMFHVNGWGMPFATAGLGIRQHVLRKVDGAEILRRVRDHGITVMCAAPAVAAAVLDAAQSWEGEIPGRDKVRIIMAGAPPPTKTVVRVQEELGWEFIQIYGLTETSPLLTVNRARAEWDDLDPHDRAALLTRAGAPALGVRLRISDDPDNAGEVLARSNTVLEGYWGKSEESAKALADGWFHTGDGGLIDDDGYLVINDRKKDVIITGGENVSSIEVEDVIFSHPAVAEVAVIGVPSEKWGETILGLVVLAEGQEVSEAELIGWCKERLAGYKAPTVIEFRESLARTATGKLQKFLLRKPYWEGRYRRVN